MKPKHVVGLSGGKDSTALATLLRAQNPEQEYEFIYNGTGNELPELHTHLRLLEGILGAEIKPVRYHTGLYGLIEEQEMIPNFQSRFCTRMLKIEPTIEYFESLPPGSVLYVGLRADEELRKGLFGEDIDVRFPFREQGWTLETVVAWLELLGIKIPERTDCGLCPYQRLGEWRNLYFQHPEVYAEGVAIEAKHKHTFRSDGRDTWPASLAELAKEFDAGRKLREFKPKSDVCRVCSL